MVSVGLRVEKFNLVSKDHGHTLNCDFSNCKYPFWSNLVQKVKIVSLSLNFVLRLTQICGMKQ